MASRNQDDLSRNASAWITKGIIADAEVKTLLRALNNEMRECLSQLSRMSAKFHITFADALDATHNSEAASREAASAITDELDVILDRTENARIMAEDLEAKAQELRDIKEEAGRAINDWLGPDTDE